MRNLREIRRDILRCCKPENFWNLWRTIKAMMNRLKTTAAILKVRASFIPAGKAVAMAAGELRPSSMIQE
jgi:hypothetical protein